MTDRDMITGCSRPGTRPQPPLPGSQFLDDYDLGERNQLVSDFEQKERDGSEQSARTRAGPDGGAVPARQAENPGRPGLAAG